jgi:radical SAM superfamily enzyme YgiQ (UPF0313 family)
LTVKGYPPPFPNADEAVRSRIDRRPEGAVDILFVNPPAPDGDIWIRCQHRVGRRSREGMIWEQVSLAQLAALFPDYRVEIIDAIPLRMGWKRFAQLLEEKRPRYYVTHVTGPTLQNDMYGAFLAKALGARTIALGTHVTPMPLSTMQPFPALDFVLRGEPELTLRELVDTLETVPGGDPWTRLAPDFRARLTRLFANTDGQAAEWNSAAESERSSDAIGQLQAGNSIPRAVAQIKGLVWRRGEEIVINEDRPLIADLDDLPLPRHDLLPLDAYRAPMISGKYAFVVSSRGCPAGCRFCIKHVTYGNCVRLRSPESIMAELRELGRLGITSIHFYADAFTASREQVMGLCKLIAQEGIKIRWTCNSRVDHVDEELLRAMKAAGCWMISWGIESGNETILKRVGKGINREKVMRALNLAQQVGIKNWGYFIIGLPGETAETIRETIDFAKQLPLYLVLFHIAAPHPGTPFFFEIVENGWFRPGTRWEEVDMDRSTVLDYPNLRAEELERWAQRAFREWAMRPGPFLSYVKMLLGSPSLWRPAIEVGLESLGWAKG